MHKTNPEYTDYIGKVHWTVAFAIPAVIWIVALVLLCGCTYNRNAPLISAPLINANGNTVPLLGQ